MRKITEPTLVGYTQCKSCLALGSMMLLKHHKHPAYAELADLWDKARKSGVDTEMLDALGGLLLALKELVGPGMFLGLRPPGVDQLGFWPVKWLEQGKQV